MERTFWLREYSREEEFRGYKDKGLKEVVEDVVKYEITKETPKLKQELQVLYSKKENEIEINSPKMIAVAFRLYMEDQIKNIGSLQEGIVLTERGFTEFKKRIIRESNVGLTFTLPEIIEDYAYLDELHSLIPFKGGYIPLYANALSSLLVWRLLISLVEGDNLVDRLEDYSNDEFVEEVGELFYIRKRNKQRIKRIVIKLNNIREKRKLRFLTFQELKFPSQFLKEH